MSEKQEIKYKDLVIKNTTVEGVKDKYITKITIPDGIKKIGDQAFTGLYALEEIEFPASLVSIGEYAFSKCGSLKRVIFTENISELGEYAFADCQQLVSADLSQAKIKVIPEGAFRECRKLADITFGSSLREIESSAFSYCQSLKTLKLPEGVLGVKDSFVGCEFESLSIPDTLKYIETISYRKVKNITISEEQYERFKLVLPKPTDVKYNLTYTITCPVCGAPYQECTCKNRCNKIEVEGTTLVKARVWEAEFIVPEHITRIADKAFYWNEDLETITLPSSIIEIGNEAFADCKKLKFVNLHQLTELTTIGDQAFAFCANLKLHDSSFFKLSKLKHIGSCAFMDTAIEHVHCVSAEFVGASAFAGCKELKSASFFQCKATFEGDTFTECSSLTEVFLPDNLTEIPFGMFSRCESLREIHIPAGVRKVCEYAFSGCRSLTEVSMMGPVESIGKSAFSFCSGLSKDFEFEFMMWEELEIIGESAFMGCDGLRHIEIPNKVKFIGKEAFSCCDYIRYFFIPKSVLTVEEDAFPDGAINGIKYDIELPYQPRGWNVELVDDRYKGIKVNWGYVSIK